MAIYGKDNEFSDRKAPGMKPINVQTAEPAATPTVAPQQRTGIRSAIAQGNRTPSSAIAENNAYRQQMLRDAQMERRRGREMQKIPQAPSEWRYRTDMRNARVGMQDPNRPGLTIGQRKAAQAALDSATGAVQAKYGMDQKAYTAAREGAEGRLADYENKQAALDAARGIQNQRGEQARLLQEARMQQERELQQQRGEQARSLQELTGQQANDRLMQEIASREGIAGKEYDLQKSRVDLEKELLERDFNSKQVAEDTDYALSRANVLAGGNQELAQSAIDTMPKPVRQEFSKMLREGDRAGADALLASQVASMTPGETQGIIPEMPGFVESLPGVGPLATFSNMARDYIPFVGSDPVAPGTVDPRTIRKAGLADMAYGANYGGGVGTYNGQNVNLDLSQPAMAALKRRREENR